VKVIFGSQIPLRRYNGGYWHQWADERFGDPPPKVDPGAYSGQRHGWKTPRLRTLWQCTASVCVAGVHCWEISLGLADPGNVIFYLFCRFILGFSSAYIVAFYSAIC